MTLAEIADFVCSKVGQLDATSQGLCRDYANRRYEMIYDTENWQDTLAFGVGSTTVDSEYLAIPDTLERVLSIRYDSGNKRLWLEKVDVPFLLETDPTIFERSGTPKYYAEERVSDVNSIRLAPTPDEVVEVDFWGKKVFAPLVEDDDSPIIRNIDNCLIAYVQGDMLQRMRQYTKAKECVEEAGTLLELMRKDEKEQSNLPRRSKNITVYGDSLEEMTDAVCCRVGDYSAPAQIMIKDFLRRSYLDLWDSQMWLESLVMVKVPREQSEVILPEYVDRVIACRGNSELAELVPADQSLFFGVAPQIFEQSGSPVNFSIMTPSAVAVLPVNNEQMMLVSTSEFDLSDVFVRGETGGVEVSETITLTGLTPVPTFNTYDLPMTIAKGLTSGYITVTGRVSGTFLVRLFENERERKHSRLWLIPRPGDIDGTTCLVLGKRKIRPLLTNEDTPLLRGIGNVLIALATSKMWSKMGNDKAAVTSGEEAKGSLQVMINRETQQTANAPRILPYVEGIPSYDYCCKGHW